MIFDKFDLKISLIYCLGRYCLPTLILSITDIYRPAKLAGLIMSVTYSYYSRADAQASLQLNLPLALRTGKAKRFDNGVDLINFPVHLLGQ